MRPFANEPGVFKFFYSNRPPPASQTGSSDVPRPHLSPKALSLEATFHPSDRPARCKSLASCLLSLEIQPAPIFGLRGLHCERSPGDFRHAVIRFREALALPESDISRDAAIQRFEFCFELAWKVIQEQARQEGLDCQSPKGCMKLAFQNNWIMEESEWLAMLEDRNRTSHTYDQQLASAVYQRLTCYVPLFEALIARLPQIS